MRSRTFPASLLVVFAACGLSACGAATEVDPDDPPPVIELQYTSSVYCNPPVAACTETYTASRDGRITHRADETVDAALNDADLARLLQFFDDPSTLTSLTNVGRCPYGTADLSTQVRLVLENYANVTRDINGCKGPYFDAIRGWVNTIAGYFP